jgi:carbon-monoxide dehydrogenase medium subunit
VKAAAFGLVRAESVEEVLAALEEHGDEARVIAGGQSLGPLMALRLAAPEVLVDISRVPGLQTLATVDGSVRVGAMVRQRTVEHSAAVRAASPLIAEAVPFIGHAAIRSQGTICGSLAHADPAAELPAVALAAGATMHLRHARGTRAVTAVDFFTGYYSTAIEPEEILEAVIFPALAPRTGTAFVEFSRRHGDFAVVGVAASVTLAPDGTIAAASLALSGVASTPWPASAAVALLLGATPQRVAAPVDGSPASGRESGGSNAVNADRVRPEAAEADRPSTPEPSGRGPDGSTQVNDRVRPDAGKYAEAVRAAAEAVRSEVEPGGDLHATPAYRRHLAAVLTARALTVALAHAEGSTR